jgi:hypothetical protein
MFFLSLFFIGSGIKACLIRDTVEDVFVPPKSITANDLPAGVVVRAFDSQARARIRIPPRTRTSMSG